MNPKTPEQLAEFIEQLVTAFIAETRRAATAAVERSLSSPLPSCTSTRVSAPRGTGKRRSPSELSQLCDALCALVCVHPGEAMPVFAAELGLSVRELHRPMSKLKSDERVRSVGERNGTRYFPAVVGKRRQD